MSEGEDAMTAETLTFILKNEQKNDNESTNASVNPSMI